MVALSANKLVWPAIDEINSITRPICSAASASERIIVSDDLAWPIALSVTLDDSSVRWAISLIEATSSSAADATDWTLLDARSDADATEVAASLACLALEAIDSAV